MRLKKDLSHMYMSGLIQFLREQLSRKIENASHSQSLMYQSISRLPPPPGTFSKAVKSRFLKEIFCLASYNFCVNSFPEKLKMLNLSQSLMYQSISRLPPPGKIFKSCQIPVPQANILGQIPRAGLPWDP